MENGREILSIPGVDGLLVGRASLIAPEFVGLVNAAAEISREEK